MCDVIAQCRMHNTNVFEVRGNIFDPAIVENVDCLSIWYTGGLSSIDSSLRTFLDERRCHLYKIQESLRVFREFDERIENYNEYYLNQRSSILFYVLNTNEYANARLDMSDVNYVQIVHDSIKLFFNSIKEIDHCKKIAISGIITEKGGNEDERRRNDHARFLMELLYQHLRLHRNIEEIYLVNNYGSGFNLHEYAENVGLQVIL
jgi:hypothetical protein